jgi:hypothetical protein
MTLLLLQAPLLGLLMLFALPANELADTPTGEIRLLSKAALVLLVIVMGTTWLGASNSVREIVKELPIFQRERAVGLSIPAYVGSKAAVLGVLTVMQAVVLVLLATARQGGPSDAVVLWWPLGELMVIAALTGLAAILRLPGLNSGFWFDEFNTVIFSVRPPLLKVATTFPGDHTHPFYGVSTTFPIPERCSTISWARRASLSGRTLSISTFSFPSAASLSASLKFSAVSIGFPTIVITFR